MPRSRSAAVTGLSVDSTARARWITLARGQPDDLASSAARPQLSDMSSVKGGSPRSAAHLRPPATARRSRRRAARILSGCEGSPGARGRPQAASTDRRHRAGPYGSRSRTAANGFDVGPGQELMGAVALLRQQGGQQMPDVREGDAHRTRITQCPEHRVPHFDAPPRSGVVVAPSVPRRLTQNGRGLEREPVIARPRLDEARRPHRTPARPSAVQLVGEPSRELARRRRPADDGDQHVVSADSCVSTPVCVRQRRDHRQRSHDRTHGAILRSAYGLAFRKMNQRAPA